MSDLEEQPKADPTPEPEPVEETQIEAADAHSDAPNWQEVFAYLWAKRSFRHLSIAAGLHAFVAMAQPIGILPFSIVSTICPIPKRATGWAWSTLSVLLALSWVASWAIKSLTEPAKNGGIFGFPQRRLIAIGAIATMGVSRQRCHDRHCGIVPDFNSLRDVFGAIFCNDPRPGDAAHARRGCGNFVVCIEPNRHGLRANVGRWCSAMC